MALELPYGYKNLNPDGSSNVDESYGYYNSVEEACLAVPLAMRKGGRTVGIKQSDGKIVEYWWENDNDLSDEGLVVKTAGGDFNPAEHDLDEFQNESSNPYVRENQIPDPFDPTQLENDIQNLKDTKVDKEAGKGLSDENFSLEEKSKLANIEEGAQVNVIPDWDADTDSPHRIDNKPTKTSDFINDGATGDSPYAEMKDLQEMIFTTDQSLYIDPITNELRANVSDFSEKYTYTSGAQEFVLTSTPAKIIYISVNGQLLEDPLTQWSIDVPTRTITILDEMDAGDRVTIHYQYFITI